MTNCQQSDNSCKDRFNIINLFFLNDNAFLTTIGFILSSVVRLRWNDSGRFVVNVCICFSPVSTASSTLADLSELIFQMKYSSIRGMFLCV